MPKIFLSYRREDSAFETAAVSDRLATEFGPANVFIDVDNIPAGQDFRKVIRRSVQECDVLIAVIGEGWLGAVDAEGRRRLDEESDFVRLEIEAALERDIPVIPLLVKGGKMPRADELPPNLRAFVYRNYLTVRAGKDFRHDIDDLFRQIRLTCEFSESERAAALPPPVPPPTAPARSLATPASTPKAPSPPGPPGPARAASAPEKPRPTVRRIARGPAPSPTQTAVEPDPVAEPAGKPGGKVLGYRALLGFANGFVATMLGYAFATFHFIRTGDLNGTSRDWGYPVMVVLVSTFFGALTASLVVREALLDRRVSALVLGQRRGLGARLLGAAGSAAIDALIVALILAIPDVLPRGYGERLYLTGIILFPPFLLARAAAATLDPWRRPRSFRSFLARRVLWFAGGCAAGVLGAVVGMWSVGPSHHEEITLIAVFGGGIYAMVVARNRSIAVAVPRPCAGRTARTAEGPTP